MPRPRWVENLDPPDDSAGRDNGPKATAPEVMAASVLAELRHEEASKIVAVWRRIFSIQLNAEMVKKHLAEIEAWQSRRGGAK
jgi:hypothetical protein